MQAPSTDSKAQLYRAYKERCLTSQFFTSVIIVWNTTGFLLFDAVHPFCPVAVQWSSVAWRSYQFTQQNLQFAWRGNISSHNLQSGCLRRLKQPWFVWCCRDFVARSPCFLVLETECLHFANVVLFWSLYSVTKLTACWWILDAKLFTYVILPNIQAVVLGWDHRWR